MASTFLSLPLTGSGGVESLNALTGALTLVAGPGIVITPTSPTELTISSPGGGVVFPFIIPAGTISAPSIAFSESGNDTGIYSTGDGNLSMAANGFLRFQIDQTLTTVTGDLDVTGDISAANYPPTGTANRLAIFDSLGALTTSNALQVESVSGGIGVFVTEQPNNVGGGFNVNNVNANFEPLQNSPNDTWNIVNHNVNLDATSSGFSQGTSGEAVTMINANISHQGTGDVGGLSIIKQNFALGNGTDPIDVKGISYAYGFGNVNANVNISGAIQGYGFQPNIDANATIDSTQSVRAFYDNANIGDATPNYISYTANPNVGSIYNNNSLQGFHFNPTVGEAVGNAGVTGLGIFSNIGTINATGNFQGAVISPNITNNEGSAIGLNINMDNVVNYAGVAASLIIQDITYTFFQAGADNNAYSMEYVDTVTAGNETVNLSGNLITVAIESGVSTATQIAAAFAANLSVSGALDVQITGVASNPQTAVTAQPFAGGINAGTKKAATFVGDVDIQGALSFTGGLSIGALNSFATKDIATLGSGVQSIDTLITAPSLAASATKSGTDLLAINTAMLLTLGDNATITSSFLGYVALGLPAVLSMGTGSTIDRVGGAAFAISLDGSATGGTADIVSLCRALAIPNGVTTINRLYGYEFDLPFGDPGTDTWGFYAAVASHNYLAGDLLIGGTAGSDDIVTNSSVALEIKSTVKAFLPSRMTTTERDALTAVNGMVLYNTTTDKLQVYAAGSWVDLH